MARVVVAGGAGFLGSHLVDALLARGDEVVCLDNLVTGSTDNVAHHLGHAGFTFVEHDVSRYVRVPGPVDVVMNLASPASPVDYLRMPIQTLKVGSLGTHNTLGLAKAKGARYLLASTSEVYGDPQVHPQPETYWGHVNPIGPRGVYDEAKRFAEAMTLAYHRHHALDIRIARVFNSVLADEQVLYDDGTQLRRETMAEAAARIGSNRDLTAVRVPAFGHDLGIEAAEALALVAHPSTQRCFEVRTRYGRSIRVTGDHSLFVRGPGRRPLARPVTQLQVGDHVAVARRIAIPERDRAVIDVLAALRDRGIPDERLVVGWEGLGATAWGRRFEQFGAIEHDLPLDLLRGLGLTIPFEARVRPRTSGRGASLPVVLPLTDELLWLMGLWVARGTWIEAPPESRAIAISGEPEVLSRAAKIVVQELGLHVGWAPGSADRGASIVVNSTLLLDLLAHLGFGPGPRRIPGWVLGLPLRRLGWWFEGYREGDGVHSGPKVADGIGHEFSTASAALKDDLVVAFARYGIVPSVRRYETTPRQRTGDRRCPLWRLTVANVTPWSPTEWHLGVRQRVKAPTEGDLIWARVTEIDEVPATPLVYDWSVPGRENFWAGTGVMAHNTYGPRMREGDGRVVSNFLTQALRGEPLTVYGDGSQTRSFCYVDDQVRGFLALLDGPHPGPVNIGNAGEFTMLELADAVRAVTGADVPIVFGPLPVDDPTQRRPDLTLARTLLGWEPEVDLPDGLARTAEHLRRRLTGG